MWGSMEDQRDIAQANQRSIRPTAPVQQDFLFVDGSKTAKSSRQGRRNARSFVMQKARRERPWSTSKYAAKQRRSPETTSPATVGTPDLSHTPITSTPSPLGIPTEYFSFTDPSNYPVVKQEICSECQIFLCRPGLNFCPRCLLLQPPAPAEEPDTGLFDPFGTASVGMDGEMTELLYHFVTEMAPGTIAVDFRQKSNLMKSDWFGTALENAGFMHSLLCTTALHRFMVGKGSPDAIYHHKVLAIAAINSAISSPYQWMGISDANIGAVFNLLSVEESLRLPCFEQDEEHPNQREMHLDGLRRMVQLRGGLKAIASNRILQAFILWHSTAHAIASFEAPYLLTLDYISTGSFPHHPRGYQPNISNHLLDYCRKVQIKESLTILVESTLVLIADLNVWFGDPESPLDPLDIQNFSCVLECLLLQWLRENEHQNLISPLEDALCVALLIFTVRTTEALQRRSGIHFLHFIANKRLEKALTATSRCEWTFCPELLLWILAIGAISAEGSAESPWFVYQTSLACSEFGIQSAEALLGRLHLCGWVSVQLDEAVYDLWELMVDLRLEPFAAELEDAGSRVTSGPLQNQVLKTHLEDWQNVDWVALSNQTFAPGTPGFGGDDTCMIWV